MPVRGVCGSMARYSHSDRFWAAFSGADTNAVFQRENENLAVADATFRPSAAGFHDCVDCWLDEVLVDGYLKLNFTQERQVQLVAPVNFGVPLLAAEALHVDDRQPENLNAIE